MCQQTRFERDWIVDPPSPIAPTLVVNDEYLERVKNTLTGSALGAAPTGGPLVQLLRHLPDMAVSELSVLVFVADRLAKGRKHYGVLNPNDGRNWDMEADEELADYMVYMAARRLQHR